jgi:hypothetical protein
MDEHDADHDPRDAAPGSAYVKPAVAWEQPFEAQAGLASACGKIAGSGEPCDSAPAS